MSPLLSPGQMMVAGVVHLLHGAVGEDDAVDDGRMRVDDVEVELAPQPLLHDLHVEKPEEAAPEAEAEGDGAFRMEGEGRVVQVELLKPLAHLLEVLGPDGVDAAEDHRAHLGVAGERLLGAVAGCGEGVAVLDLLGVLDGADDVAHLAGLELADGLLVGAEDADFADLRRDAA